MLTYSKVNPNRAFHENPKSRFSVAQTRKNVAPPALVAGKRALFYDIMRKRLARSINSEQKLITRPRNLRHADVERSAVHTVISTLHADSYVVGASFGIRVNGFGDRRLRTVTKCPTIPVGIDRTAELELVFERIPRTARECTDKDPGFRSLEINAMGLCPCGPFPLSSGPARHLHSVRRNHPWSAGLGPFHLAGWECDFIDGLTAG